MFFIHARDEIRHNIFLEIESTLPQKSQLVGKNHLYTRKN